MCCDPALPLLPTAIESRSGTGTLPQACGLNRSRTSTHIPIPRTVSADRLLIFSLSENRRGTIFRSSAPPKPRLPAGQMRSPVSFFHNLSQVPVDLAAHIRYTGLAFFGSFSHIHFKRKRRTGQPFLAALFVFFTFFLQRAHWGIDQAARFAGIENCFYGDSASFDNTERSDGCFPPHPSATPTPSPQGEGKGGRGNVSASPETFPSRGRWPSVSEVG